MLSVRRDQINSISRKDFDIIVLLMKLQIIFRKYVLNREKSVNIAQPDSLHFSLWLSDDMWETEKIE